MARVTKMAPTDVRQRAATAREHYQVTLERLVIAAGRPGPSSEAQVAASNAVSAAIAASDAICGAANGERVSDQDHRAAIAMLRAVRPDGAALARHLNALLNDKTLLQYGTFCTDNAADAARKHAEALVDALDTHGI